MYSIKSMQAVTKDMRNLIVAAGITVLALCATFGLTAHAQYCGVGGYQMDAGGGCYDVGGNGSTANVQMTANPALIQQGANSVLSWGPDDASARYPYDTCTIDHGVGTVSNTGSKTVSPAVTTDYGITCTHYVQYSVPCGNTNCDASYTEVSNANATITVTPNPTLAASCSVSPTAIATNGSATWSATASGGNGSFTYSWSGTDSLSGSTASVTKTYPAAGTKTGSVTVTSGAQTVTQACGSGLTVTPPTAADVSPVSLTPSTVIAQQASTFTATMYNGGNAATPPFSSTAYVCQTGDTACQNSILALNTKPTLWGRALSFFAQVAHAAVSVNLTFSHLTLGAGVTGTQTVSTTFPSPGSYQIRLCGDLPNNEVPESNENNNCGNWQVLTVCPVGNTIDGSGNCVVPPPPPPPPSPTPTCSLTANPSSAPSTLTWASTNATTCSAGGFSTGGALNGSVSAGAGSYTFSCTGTGGSCSTSASVGSAACTNPAGTLSAAPNRIRAGQSTSISYAASGITTSCTLSGPGVNQTIPATTCAVPSGSVPTGALSAQSTYILTCDGIERARTIVNIVPKFIEF